MLLVIAVGVLLLVVGIPSPSYSCSRSIHALCIAAQHPYSTSM